MNRKLNVLTYKWNLNIEYAYHKDGNNILGTTRRGQEGAGSGLKNHLLSIMYTASVVGSLGPQASASCNVPM